MYSEWPRPYTAVELEAIAKSVGRDKLSPLAVGKLQEAAEAYQWGSLADHWDSLGEQATHRSANKRRREPLENIIKLCEEEAGDELGIVLNELDALTSQFLGDLKENSLRAYSRHIVGREQADQMDWPSEV